MFDMMDKSTDKEDGGKTVLTERSIVTEILVQFCERNMMEILKGKYVEDDGCEKVQLIKHYVRRGFIKFDNCEVASEVLWNHLGLTVVIILEQQNVQEKKKAKMIYW
jgi:hypothetical protein